MAIYKRNSVWWARFTINGVKYRQSLGTNDRRAALDEEKVRVAKAMDGKLAPPGTPFVRLNFGDAVDLYIEDRKSRVAENTAKTEAERGKMIKGRLGHLSLKKLSAETVLAYMRERKGSGVSNGTVNRELDVIRGVLRRAKLWTPLSDEVQALPVRENVGRVLTYEEKLRLIITAKQRPEWQSMRLAMTLALNTTMRASEVRTLRWQNIDLIGKSLKVHKSKTEAGERKIPLNSAAYLAVMELRERAKRLFGETLQPNWYLFPLRAERANPDPLKPVGSWKSAWLTLTRSIVCPECRQLQKPGKNCWRASCQADISKLRSVTAGFRFHDLRHQAITELSEGGASDATIMGIAGHVSRKMLEHYSHARFELKRDALEGLGNRGRGTVGAQNRLFDEDNVPQVLENIGGRDRGRTGDLIVANDALSQLSYSPTSSV
jgi:integrase